MSKTIAGIVTVLLAQFMTVEEVNTILTAIGIVLSYYGRYSIGDITWYGTRKEV